MSYLIWLMLGKRNRYPTGMAWLVLSFIRLLDWAAFIGITIYLVIQVAGFAVDARSYMHYLTMESEYDYDLTLEKEKVETDADSGVRTFEAYDANFESFRKVEKQRAMYSWYGELLVFEENVWDLWRSIFNSETFTWGEYSLIPFFWVDGADSYRNSSTELDGYYTLLGIDGRAKKWTSDTTGYYLLSNLYNTTNTGYVDKALTAAGNPSGLREKFDSCRQNADVAFQMGYTMTNVDLTPASTEYFTELKNRHNKAKERMDSTTDCFISIQNDLGVKQYPTQEMLEYNEMVVSYHSNAIDDAIERAEAEKAKNGDSSRGVAMYNNYTPEWERAMLNKYVYQCGDNCEGVRNVQVEGKAGIKGALVMTPFYDVVVADNEAYKD